MRRDVNNDVMEMLIMGYAFKTSSARRIIGVIPYLPYSKQSKMRMRGCVVAKLLAQMLSMSGNSSSFSASSFNSVLQRGCFGCICGLWSPKKCRPVMQASNFMLYVNLHVAHASLKKY